MILFELPVVDKGADVVSVCAVLLVADIGADVVSGLLDGIASVSYTHLTLPTTPYV